VVVRAEEGVTDKVEDAAGSAKGKVEDAADVTKNDTRIKADTYFVCIGKRVGSSWLRNSDLSELLDKVGGKAKQARHSSSVS
jgi:hypothetical protein